VTSSVKIDLSKKFAPADIPVENSEKAREAEDMVVENETVLSGITNEKVTKKTYQPISSPPSPFSKHLSLPLIDRSTAPRVQTTTMPKAITGPAYRKLLQRRKPQREELEKEKEERKHERMVKRKMKEDKKTKTKDRKWCEAQGTG